MIPFTKSIHTLSKHDGIDAPLIPVGIDGEAHEAVPEDAGDDEDDEDGQQEHGVRGEDRDVRHLQQ